MKDTNLMTSKLQRASIYLRIAAKAERAGDQRLAGYYQDAANRLAFEQRLEDLELFGTA